MARKSFLIIGAGKFGHYLTRELSARGSDILLADENEDKLSDLLDCVVSAKIGDCTRRDVLTTFGVEDFDACIVCVSDNFQNSLQITDLLRELNARRIISLAATSTQAKFLLKNGADEVVLPERDMAERLAVSIGNDSIYDYFELSKAYSLFEITPPPALSGRTLAQEAVRAKYGVNIVAVKPGEGEMFIPDGGYVFNGRDHLMVLGRNEDVDRFLRG